MVRRIADALEAQDAALLELCRACVDVWRYVLSDLVIILALILVLLDGSAHPLRHAERSWE
jgi:hypothetical protein